MAPAKSVHRRTSRLKFKSSENEYADTLFSGVVQPGAAFFVWRVRVLCTRHFDTQLFVAQKHGISLGKPSRMASTLAKMPRGPLLQSDAWCVFCFFELQTLDPARLEIEPIDTKYDENENPLPQYHSRID